MSACNILISRAESGTTAAQWRGMTKFLKTVLIAGSLLTSTAIVLADTAPKAADKAGAGSGSATSTTKNTKGTTTTPAKGSGAGSAAKSGK
jgi:hypothetical protein